MIKEYLKYAYKLHDKCVENNRRLRLKKHTKKQYVQNPFTGEWYEDTEEMNELREKYASLFGRYPENYIDVEYCSITLDEFKKDIKWCIKHKKELDEKYGVF